MHARVELHDAVLVRQSAESDRLILGIELLDVDAGDRRVERIAPRDDDVVGDLTPRLLRVDVSPFALAMTAGRPANDFPRQLGALDDADERQRIGAARQGEPRRGGALAVRKSRREVDMGTSKVQATHRAATWRGIIHPDVRHRLSGEQ